MSQHPYRPGREYSFRPADDGQIGPDADAWPGDQMRHIEERYRSWRLDRYRQFPDERVHQQPERSPPRGDGTPPLHDRQEHAGS